MQAVCTHLLQYGILVLHSNQREIFFLPYIFLEMKKGDTKVNNFLAGFTQKLLWNLLIALKELNKKLEKGRLNRISNKNQGEDKP